jgi:hypothetical protein
VNRLRSLIRETLEKHGLNATRWDLAYWISWKEIGLVAAAVLLPFGWILPVARLARAWAATRRGPNC